VHDIKKVRDALVVFEAVRAAANDSGRDGDGGRDA